MVVRLGRAWPAPWWLLPLLTLGRFSPPFYEYVESASNTTGVIGWSEALRGASHWVAFITTGGRGWWPAAHAYAFEPLLILVAAARHRRSACSAWSATATPCASRWSPGLALGLAALTVAHGGWEGSPLSGFFLDALEGPLQVFRNVHKVDPTVRFAVAMGFAAAVAEASLLVARPRRAARPPTGRSCRVSPPSLVLVLGQPFLVNDARTPGWERGPRGLAAGLRLPRGAPGRHHHAGRARARGSPSRAGAGPTTSRCTRSATRSAGPPAARSRSSPGQSIRVLSAIDRLVSQGEAGRSLGPQLARAGVGYVLVRRDLTRGFTDSPPPAGAAQSLTTAGFRQVATFGEFADGGREIEVYEVPDRMPRVRSTLRSDVADRRGCARGLAAARRHGPASTRPRAR